MVTQQNETNGMPCLTKDLHLTTLWISHTFKELPINDEEKMVQIRFWNEFDTHLEKMRIRRLCVR